MSMKPGATYVPDASIARSDFARPRRPTSAIFPPRIPTSATRPGEPVPSRTRPPRMTTSNAIPWRTAGVPLTSFRETIEANRHRVESQPFFRLTIGGRGHFRPMASSFIAASEYVASHAGNRLYHASVRAPTYRYHAIVGGRTPSVSPADEEICAGVGDRKDAEPLRSQQQLPSRRSVPAVLSQGERFADWGRGRNGIRRLLHGLRRAGRGSQPPGPREGDARAGVERHDLWFRVGRRGPTRGSRLSAVRVGPPQVLDDGSRCDVVRGSARSSRHGSPPDPEVRRLLPRFPRRTHGVDQAEERGLRRPKAAEPGAVVERTATGTRTDRGRRALQRPLGDGGDRKSVV